MWTSNWNSTCDDWWRFTSPQEHKYRQERILRNGQGLLQMWPTEDAAFRLRNGHKEFVLVLGASGTESTNIVQTYIKLKVLYVGFWLY